MNVLVVDRDRGSRRLVEIAFASSGHHVVAAPCVQGAQAEVVTTCPDLIIASLDHDEDDVLEWCNDLRRSLSVRTPLLWAVTNRPQREVQTKADQAGIDLLLLKPVDLLALLVGAGADNGVPCSAPTFSLDAALQAEFYDRRVWVGLSVSQ